MIELPSDKKLPSAHIGFDAVVGHSELKEALLAVTANDSLSGLLIEGEKGTAKSTAVRGMVELLPEQRVVVDCPFGCSPTETEKQCTACRERENPPVETRSVPLVTLPLGATRERVVGTLSISQALSGEPEFDPGLLARANRGILYVDEVNLLEDHLVDVLLDAAASGVNRIERDGVSLTHPSTFTLIGTMNPEEGDLRPQLRDRFALRASVEGTADLDDRVAIIDRALGESEKESESTTTDSRDRLFGARERLERVRLPEEHKRDIAELCRNAGVDGHRADIATARAARTLAALDGRSTVLESDVRRAAELALPHRLRSHPFEDTPDPEEILEDHFGNESEKSEQGEEDNKNESSETSEDTGESPPENDRNEPGDGDGPDETNSRSESERASGGDSARSEEAGGEDGSNREGDEGDGSDKEHDDGNATPLIPGESRAEIGEATAPRIEPKESDSGGDSIIGSHSDAPKTGKSGPRVRTEPAALDETIDAAASVRAAASRGARTIESRDLRRSVRVGRESALVVFALDASASMGGPMRAAKGVVMDLLEGAYENRDEVSVVTFAGEESEVLLPPTNSVSMAARHLKELPTGDRTPLAAGLRTAGEVLHRADPAVGVVVLVTDGRANSGGTSPTADTRRAARRLGELGTDVIVVDAGDPEDRTALIGEIVRVTDGKRVPLSAFSAEGVEDVITQAR